jgi:hypothetical protein
MNAVANSRHKRVTNARSKMSKTIMLSVPLAVAATGVAVSAGVFGGNLDNANLVANAGNSLSATGLGGTSGAGITSQRSPEVSRGQSRSVKSAPDFDMTIASREASRLARQDAAQVQRAATKARLAAKKVTARAIRNADTRLWVTTDLNVWSSSTQNATKIGELNTGDKALVTSRTAGGRSEIVVKGQARWVTSGYFSEEKPVAEIGGECTNGSSVESGVSSNIVKVHEAVCAAFPEIITYGTLRGDGEHSQGLAVDIMVSGDRGWEVADFVRENYADLGVSYVIYSQKIWSVERSSEGWRGMPDRGSTTANHYDHVHVTTN